MAFRITIVTPTLDAAVGQWVIAIILIKNDKYLINDTLVQVIFLGIGEDQVDITGQHIQSTVMINFDLFLYIKQWDRPLDFFIIIWIDPMNMKKGGQYSCDIHTLIWMNSNLHDKHHYSLALHTWPKKWQEKSWGQIN